MEDVREFIVSEDNIAKGIKKRKNWTALGIDDIENFWWSMFEVCWRPLSEIMNQWIERKDCIPEWLTLGRTVVLPKMKDLSSKKDSGQ